MPSDSSSYYDSNTGYISESGLAAVSGVESRLQQKHPKWGSWSYQNKRQEMLSALTQKLLEQDFPLAKGGVGDEAWDIYSQSAERLFDQWVSLSPQSTSEVSLSPVRKPQWDVALPGIFLSKWQFRWLQKQQQHPQRQQVVQGERQEQILKVFQRDGSFGE